MKLEAYCVFDTQVSAFMNPQFFRSRGEAMRAFTAGVNAEGSMFSANADDYVFFYVGSWDDAEGRFSSPDIPERIVTARSVLISK